MGNGNIPYFFRIRKFAVGLPLAGNGNIPYFFRIRKFAVRLPLAGNGNTHYGTPKSSILSAIFNLEPKLITTGEPVVCTEKVICRLPRKLVSFLL